MTCPLCLALDFASDDSLRALVLHQAIQLDRLTGGRYVAPEPDDLFGDDGYDDDFVPPPPLLALTERLLAEDDIFRKPPRVAAPRLLERLAASGWHLIPEETD